MSEPGQDGATFKDAFAQAAHHHNAMVERRNIGLRIVVGVVAFDLIVLKLALEAADNVNDHAELAWAIRLIAAGAFVVLAGMLLQIEIRNRDDRAIYTTATTRAERIRLGEPPENDSQASQQGIPGPSRQGGQNLRARELGAIDAWVCGASSSDRPICRASLPS
jgi:hypothetical protein